MLSALKLQREDKTWKVSDDTFLYLCRSLEIGLKKLESGTDLPPTAFFFSSLLMHMRCAVEISITIFCARWYKWEGGGSGWSFAMKSPFAPAAAVRFLISKSPREKKYYYYSFLIHFEPGYWQSNEKLLYLLQWKCCRVPADLTSGAAVCKVANGSWWSLTFCSSSFHHSSFRM